MASNLLENRSTKYGLMLIALSALVWILRPFKECEWYQLACHSGGALTNPIFLIASIILLIVGVRILVKNGGK